MTPQSVIVFLRETLETVLRSEGCCAPHSRPPCFHASHRHSVKEAWRSTRSGQEADSMSSDTKRDHRVLICNRQRVEMQIQTTDMWHSGGMGRLKNWEHSFQHLNLCLRQVLFLLLRDTICWIRAPSFLFAADGKVLWGKNQTVHLWSLEYIHLSQD